MEVSNEFFDQLHIEHPHRVREDRARKELHLSPAMVKALKNGEVVSCEDGHRMVLTAPRSVSPWINWRREFEKHDPDLAKKILAANKPRKYRFVEVS